MPRQALADFARDVRGLIVTDLSLSSIEKSCNNLRCNHNVVYHILSSRNLFLWSTTWAKHSSTWKSLFNMWAIIQPSSNASLGYWSYNGYLFHSSSVLWHTSSAVRTLSVALVILKHSSPAHKISPAKWLLQTTVSRNLMKVISVNPGNILSLKNSSFIVIVPNNQHGHNQSSS